MKRRQFLSTIGGSVLLAGCNNQNNDQQGGGEPTIRTPTQSASYPEPDQILSAGEWATVSIRPYGDLGLRIDDVEFKYRFLSLDSDVRDVILPDGKEVGIIKYTVKNLLQDTIETPAPSISILSGERTFGNITRIPRSQNCEDPNCSPRPDIDKFRVPFSAPYGGRTGIRIFPGKKSSFWTAAMVPEDLGDFYVTYALIWWEF